MRRCQIERQGFQPNPGSNRRGLGPARWQKKPRCQRWGLWQRDDGKACLPTRARRSIGRAVLLPRPSLLQCDGPEKREHADPQLRAERRDDATRLDARSREPLEAKQLRKLDAEPLRDAEGSVE